MPIISSISNPCIQQVKKLLSSAGEREKQGLMVLEGDHVCGEFLRQTGLHFEQFFYTEKFVSTQAFSKFSAEKNGIMVSEKVLKAISDSKTPSGMAAVAKIPKQLAQENYSFCFALDRVQDPGNVGTIIRTAAAFGVSAIFLSSGCADVWSPKVLRSAQGGHFYLNLFPNFDLRKLPKVFRGKIFTTDTKGVSVFQTDLSGPVCFLLGNEGGGISSAIKKMATKTLSIPLQNNFESLNVGIAAGIFCAEKTKKIPIKIRQV